MFIVQLVSTSSLASHCQESRRTQGGGAKRGNCPPPAPLKIERQIIHFIIGKWALSKHCELNTGECAILGVDLVGSCSYVAGPL